VAKTCCRNQERRFRCWLSDYRFRLLVVPGTILDETDSGLRESFHTCHWAEAMDYHTFGSEHDASEEAGRSNRDCFRKVPGEVDNSLLDIPIEVVGHCRPMAEHPSEVRPAQIPWV